MTASKRIWQGPRALVARLRPIGEITADPKNTRIHGEASIRAIAASLREFGQQKPVVIGKGGTTAAGNGMLEAANRLGWTHIACTLTDLEPTALKAFAIADNRSAESSTWDEAVLAAALADIEAEEARLIAATGFSPSDIAAMMSEAPPEPGEDDPPPPARKPRVKRGQVWKLGEHRLICADATDKTTYAQLLEGDKEPVRLVWTDPPYGIDYTRPKHAKLAGDDMDPAALALEVIVPALHFAVHHAAPDAAFYVWHDGARQDECRIAIRQAGLVWRQNITWIKPNFTIGYAHYRNASEVCAYAGIDSAYTGIDSGEGPRWLGGRSESNVWRITPMVTAGMAAAIGTGILIVGDAGNRIWLAPAAPKGRKTRRVNLEKAQAIYLQADGANLDAWEVARDHRPEHATQKPIELARRPIVNHTERGDICLDAFAGSGTLLLACEATGRIARVAELDPANCDTIIRRWERATNKRARKA